MYLFVVVIENIHDVAADVRGGAADYACFVVDRARLPLL